jgi:hypothetical protein
MAIVHARLSNRGLLTATPVRLALAAFIVTLLVLTSVTVRRRDGNPHDPTLNESACSVPPFELVGAEGLVDPGAFRRMAVSADLFHGIVPQHIALRIGYYAVIAWGAVAVMWAIYLWVIWRTRSRPVGLRAVVCGAVALSVLAVTVPPIYSTDSFGYAIYGRIAADYGANPYTTSPASTASADPLMPYVYWRDIASPYGPVWTLISQGAVHAPGSPLEVAVRFKLIALAATLANGWLIYTLVKRRWPDNAGWAYLAFSWNPLVLVEGIVAAHNDAVMLTVVLLAAHLMVRARGELSMVALTVAGLVKVTIVPIAAISALRLLARTRPARRPAVAGRLMLSSAGVTLCAIAPFWCGADLLGGLLSQPENGVNNPIPLVLAGLASNLPARAQVLGTPMALVGLAVMLFAARELRSLRHLTADVTEGSVFAELAHWATSLSMLLLVFPRVYTWYFLVPLGLAVAAGPAHRGALKIVLSLSLLSYVTYFR